MRRELKARNISKLKVVYSKEVPQKPKEVEGIKKENVENYLKFFPSSPELSLSLSYYEVQ